MSKFHINKHGVPAPCRAQKGNCPLGGNESHFDTAEEAQVYADKRNEDAHGILPSTNGGNDKKTSGFYVGYYYDVSEHAHENMRSSSDPFLTKDNFKEVLDSGFEVGDIEIDYELDSMGNPPVNFNGTLSRVGDDEYHVKGSVSEYLYEERDFDSKKEFETYMEGEPDGVYNVDLLFTKDDLQDTVEKTGPFDGDWKVSQHQASPAIFKGVFHLAKDNAESE